MRTRLPSPVRPFDPPPTYMVEAAKQIFSMWPPHSRDWLVEHAEEGEPVSSST